MRFRPSRLLRPINLVSLAVALVFLGAMLARGSSFGAGAVGLGILLGLTYASYSQQGELDTRWPVLVARSTKLSDLSVTTSKRFILLSLSRGHESCSLVRRNGSARWEVRTFKKSEVGNWRHGSTVLLDEEEMATFVQTQGRSLDPQFAEAVTQYVTKLRGE